MMELAGNFRPYNGCIERLVIIGTPSGEQRSMYRLVEAILLRGPLGRFYKIHRSTLDAGWFGGHSYAAFGYPLGGTYWLSWMDVPPMIYASHLTEFVLTWCFSHMSYLRTVILG